MWILPSILLEEYKQPNKAKNDLCAVVILYEHFKPWHLQSQIIRYDGLQ